MNSKFLICPKCKNMIHSFCEDDKEIICCGEKMKELVPNTVEANVEKHVPVVNIEGNKLSVQVGVTPHPQTEEHYISWIYVRCGANTQGKQLTYKDEPVAEFYGDWKGKVEVQAYCNLHGIWLSTLLC